MTRDDPRGGDGSGLWRRTRGPLMLGGAVVVGFVGTFGAWAGLAPLAGGAVAQGVISPEGSSRIVQHLEGGILAAIHVRDGDVVDAGEPLAVFAEVQARSRYDMLAIQRDAQLANLARISAEDLGKADIDVPPALAARAAAHAEVAELLASQRHVFETRRRRLAAERDTLRERIDQVAAEIRGLEAQVASATRQLAIIAEEIADKRALVAKNLMPKPQLLAVERIEAGLLGDRGEYEARIARARQEISEADLRLVTLEAERADANARERDRRLAALAEINEQLTATADVLERTVLTAPVAGTVHDLQFKTVGGVVPPGAALMHVVPVAEELVIDARVAPTDVDVVEAGLAAEVDLVALSGRRTPRIAGVVRAIAADRSVDATTGEAFYLARVEVDRAELAQQFGDTAALVPGMPAQVLIVSSERTLLSYLTKPLIDAFRRSFRED